MMATLFSTRLCEHQSASHFDAFCISVFRVRAQYVHGHASGSLPPGGIGSVEYLYSVNKSNDTGDHAPG